MGTALRKDLGVISQDQVFGIDRFPFSDSHRQYRKRTFPLVEKLIMVLGTRVVFTIQFTLDIMRSYPYACFGMRNMLGRHHTIQYIVSDPKPIKTTGFTS
uniref:Uncharacterized protein n=1 Tax=Candidatus Kentrum sp. LFY TaxID=2126342 RepID=A0A450U6R4_9GAMM|nr:MAG: hypothetical protein BECKLFY1418A_GA0070994_100178 [Candidatus Kentron sp. LFY]